MIIEKIKNICMHNKVKTLPEGKTEMVDNNKGK
jgi:hypothetical protein